VRMCACHSQRSSQQHGVQPSVGRGVCHAASDCYPAPLCRAGDGQICCKRKGEGSQNPACSTASDGHFHVRLALRLLVPLSRGRFLF
jgi:hypothetical protein